MRIETSLTQFFKDLETAKDEHVQGMLRFQLMLAQRIQFQTQDNIKKTFGAGNGNPKSPITTRLYGNTARSSGRGGGLFGSVAIQREADASLSVTAGGVGVPYAQIHELGGRIVPRKGRYLTIPFNPKYARTRAREHQLKFGFDEDLGAVLVQAGAVGSNGRYNKSDIAFLLRRQATIRARPYFKPAVDAVSTDNNVREGMERFFKGAQIKVDIV